MFDHFVKLALKELLLTFNSYLTINPFHVTGLFLYSLKTAENQRFFPSFLRIWLHLLKKSLMENFSFCAVCGRHKCNAPGNAKFLLLCNTRN